jgi:hypothetical protein
VLPVIGALLPSPAVEPASTFLFWMRPQHDDDHPFIVLTETKFSLRCIPVWIGTLHYKIYGSRYFKAVGV